MSALDQLLKTQLDSLLKATQQADAGHVTLSELQAAAAAASGARPAASMPPSQPGSAQWASLLQGLLPVQQAQPAQAAGTALLQQQAGGQQAAWESLAALVGAQQMHSAVASQVTAPHGSAASSDALLPHALLQQQHPQQQQLQPHSASSGGSSSSLYEVQKALELLVALKQQQHAQPPPPPQQQSFSPRAAAPGAQLWSSGAELPHRGAFQPLQPAQRPSQMWDLQAPLHTQQQQQQVSLPCSPQGSAWPMPSGNPAPQHPQYQQQQQQQQQVPAPTQMEEEQLRRGLLALLSNSSPLSRAERVQAVAAAAQHIPPMRQQGPSVSAGHLQAGSESASLAAAAAAMAAPAWQQQQPGRPAPGTPSATAGEQQHALLTALLARAVQQPQQSTGGVSARAHSLGYSAGAGELAASQGFAAPSRRQPQRQQQAEQATSSLSLGCRLTPELRLAMRPLLLRRRQEMEDAFQQAGFTPPRGSEHHTTPFSTDRHSLESVGVAGKAAPSSAPGSPRGGGGEEAPEEVGTAGAAGASWRERAQSPAHGLSAAATATIASGSGGTQENSRQSPEVWAQPAPQQQQQQQAAAAGGGGGGGGGGPAVPAAPAPRLHPHLARPSPFAGAPAAAVPHSPWHYQHHQYHHQHPGMVLQRSFLPPRGSSSISLQPSWHHAAEELLQQLSQNYEAARAEAEELYGEGMGQAPAPAQQQQQQQQYQPAPQQQQQQQQPLPPPQLSGPPAGVGAAAGAAAAAAAATPPVPAFSCHSQGTSAGGKGVSPSGCSHLSSLAHARELIVTGGLAATAVAAREARALHLSDLDRVGQEVSKGSKSKGPAGSTAAGGRSAAEQEQPTSHTAAVATPSWDALPAGCQQQGAGAANPCHAAAAPALEQPLEAAAAAAAVHVPAEPSKSPAGGSHPGTVRWSQLLGLAQQPQQAEQAQQAQQQQLQQGAAPGGGASPSTMSLPGVEPQQPSRPASQPELESQPQPLPAQQPPAEQEQPPAERQRQPPSRVAARASAAGVPPSAPLQQAAAPAAPAAAGFSQPGSRPSGAGAKPSRPGSPEAQHRALEAVAEMLLSMQKQGCSQQQGPSGAEPALPNRAAGAAAAQDQQQRQQAQHKRQGPEEPAALQSALSLKDAFQGQLDAQACAAVAASAAGPAHGLPAGEGSRNPQGSGQGGGSERSWPGLEAAGGGSSPKGTWRSGDAVELGGSGAGAKRLDSPLLGPGIVIPPSAKRRRTGAPPPQP